MSSYGAMCACRVEMARSVAEMARYRAVMYAHDRRVHSVALNAQKSHFPTGYTAVITHSRSGMGGGRVDCRTTLRLVWRSIETDSHS